MDEVASGADRDLQDLALGLRAGPLPAAGEQHAVEEVHLPVVAAGVLVLNPAYPLCLARWHGAGAILPEPAAESID